MLQKSGSLFHRRTHGFQSDFHLGVADRKHSDGVTSGYFDHTAADDSSAARSNQRACSLLIGRKVASLLFSGASIPFNRTIRGSFPRSKIVTVQPTVKPVSRTVKGCKGRDWGDSIDDRNVSLGMDLPADFFPQVLGYLLMDCPVIATEPEAEPIKEGTWTSYGEFFVQLSRQVEDGLAVAKSRVALWARTGKPPHVSGTAAFVLVMSIRSAAQETGIAFPEGKIEGDLPGPPWSEETVNEIIRLIFGDASKKALTAWMDKTAQDCFRSQPWNT